MLLELYWLELNSGKELVPFDELIKGGVLSGQRKDMQAEFV